MFEADGRERALEGCGLSLVLSVSHIVHCTQEVPVGGSGTEVQVGLRDKLIDLLLETCYQVLDHVRWGPVGA